MEIEKIKVLGDRVLVSRITDDTPKQGYEVVDVQDSFIYKGKVEKIGIGATIGQGAIGDIVIFNKYSPDNQDIGKDHKIISVNDILAIYE